MKILAYSTFCLLIMSMALKPQKDDKVIQIDIRKILNARPVTTLTKGKLVRWKKGIDGDGAADGYFTLSAALFNGDKAPHALPDEPIFQANECHPEIKLYYSNQDSVHNQAVAIIGKGGVSFAVPKCKYGAVYLALLSAQGTTSLHVKLIYTTGIEKKDFVIPDYFWDIPVNDPNYCYLAHDIAKWNNKGVMAEKDHHNIDLLKIYPDPLKTLKSIYISKNKPGYLMLWAAVGVKVD